MQLTGLVQRYRRLALTVVGIAVAPFAGKLTCACISHPEIDTNIKIIGETTNRNLYPPLSKTVCGTDLFFQQEADIAIFTEVAEELAQENHKRGRLGLAPLTPQEITAQTMARFKDKWKAAVKRVTAPRKLPLYR